MVADQALVAREPQVGDALQGSWRGICLSRTGSVPVTFVPAEKADCQQVVSIINQVAAERIYLQTDQYRPTATWERLLDQRFNVNERFALFVVKYRQNIIGFGRLCPDEAQPLYGNVGIVLVRAFRSIGIGTVLLGLLIDWALCLGYRKMTADVLATNVCSVRLFRRFRFEERDVHDIDSIFTSEKIQEITFELDL